MRLLIKQILKNKSMYGLPGCDRRKSMIKNKIKKQVVYLVKI